MSSKRLKVLLVSLLAVFAVSAVASASASATCLQVVEAKTGNWENNICTITGTSKEFIKVIKLETWLAPGQWCAKVEEAATGNYETNKCEAATKKAGSAFIKVISTPEPYQFLKGGASIAGKEFKGVQQGNSILRGTGVEIVCTSGTSEGKFATNTSMVEKVKVIFKGCTSAGGTCSVKSIKPLGAAGEIITEVLKGVIGEQTGAGAGGDEVALDLEPETNAEHVFVEIEGAAACLALTKVKNAIIGEVFSPIDEEKVEGELKFKENAGGTAQLLQNIEEEGSGGIADGPEHLEGFGTATRLTNNTKIKLTTGEAFEVKDNAAD